MEQHPGIIFLNTAATARAIREVITTAHNRIVLISPFIDPAEDIYNKLEEASKRVSQIIVICRENDLKPAVKQRFTRIPKLQILFHEKIHAKHYFNEDKSIYTSLNLTQLSEQKNGDSGTLYDGIIDRSIYNKSLAQPEAIVSDAIAISLNQNIKINFQYKANANPYRNRKFQIWNFEEVPGEKGVCIRCKKQLAALNGYFSLCNNCYIIWSKWLDPDFVEKYCNWCGEEHPTSKNKPFCGSCWNKYKTIRNQQAGKKTTVDYSNKQEAKPKEKHFSNQHSYSPPHPPKTEQIAEIKNKPQVPDSLTVNIGRIIGLYIAFLLKHIKFILIGTAVLLLLYFVLTFFKETSKSESKIRTDHENLRLIIRNYYHDIRLGRFDANNYFAPRVKKYIMVTNTTPDQINSFNKKDSKEFMYPESEVQESTIVFSKDNTGHDVAEFLTKFICFRKSKAMWEKAMVTMQFVFDKNHQVIKLTEKSSEVKFSYQK